MTIGRGSADPQGRSLRRSLGRLPAGVAACVALAALGACTLMAPAPAPAPTPATPLPTPVEAPAPAALPPASPGVVVGWVSGEERRDRRRRSMLAFGAQPLAAGEIDGYVDGLESGLRDRLRGTPCTVTRIGVNVTVSVPGAFAFTTDGAELKLGSTSAFEAIAAAATASDRTMLEVAGHTDDSGADGYNQSLAERRAGAIAQRLQSRGVNPQRIVTIGVGEGRPIAPNSTADGRQRNRRVEITFAPLTAR